MKLGNYGSGKSYTYRSTQSNGGGNKGCGILECLVCSLIVLLPFSIYWMYIEYSSLQQLKKLELISKDFYQLVPGQAGIDQIFNYQGYDGRTVHLNNVQVAPKSNIQDDMFYIATDASSLRRNVNYCQWVEYRHESQRKIGSNNGTDIYETTVYYTYSLEWRDYQINSLFFNSALSYNNPSRDNIAKIQVFAEGAIGDSQSGQQLSVDGSFLKMQDEYQLPLTIQSQISPYAQAQGFDRTDGIYLYSPYQESPLYSGVKKAAQLFFEGVIDIGNYFYQIIKKILGLKGKCTPGDIRVSWYATKFYPYQSIMGQLQNNELITIKNTGLILSGIGSMTGEELIHFYENSTENYRFWIRLLEFIFVSLSGTLGYVQFQRQQNGIQKEYQNVDTNPDVQEYKQKAKEI